MMTQISRIQNCFQQTRKQRRAALIGYLTAFDPSRTASLERLFAACEAGLDILELGVPFSDPTADGPVIEAAMKRGLAGGASLEGVLELATQIRKRFAVPIVLFSYANPLLQASPEQVGQSFVDAGIDGILVVDLPPEHSDILRLPMLNYRIDWIGMCAPTSPPARIKKIVEVSRGFVYAVSLTGVTGASFDINDSVLTTQIETIRKQKDALPIAVGFGVRTPEQVRSLSARVDGVVIGSALIEAAQKGIESLKSTIRDFVAAL